MQHEVETLLTQGDFLVTTGNESPLLGSDVDQSRNLIADYITNFLNGFRQRNQGADVFFTEIELNKYLQRCKERNNSLDYTRSLDHSYRWRAVIKHNNICLDAAKVLLKNAKEQFERFRQVSMNWKSKQLEPPKKKSFWANTFGWGREADYNHMTNDIPPGLYFVSLYLAYAFFLLELKLTQECEALYANGKIHYNRNTNQIIGLTQLYSDIRNQLLGMIKTNPTERDIEELHNYINTQVDSFMAPLREGQPSAGGRTRRRSSLHSRKSRRGKKRVTKHRVRRV